MPVQIARIAAATGLSWEHVANELGDHRDPLFQDSIVDDVARQFVADVKRSQRRHQLLVAEYDADKAAWMAQRDEIYRKAYEDALPARRKANRKLLRYGAVVADKGDELFDMGGEAERQAQREALQRARAALEKFDDARGRFAEFSDWANGTNAGKRAKVRVEKILEAQGVPA